MKFLNLRSANFFGKNSKSLLFVMAICGGFSFLFILFIICNNSVFVSNLVFCASIIPHKRVLSILFSSKFSIFVDIKSIPSISILKKLYESHNIDINKEIITYCRLGHRASLTWYILKYILKSPNVRVYDGSWTEWGNSIGMPIKKIGN